MTKQTKNFTQLSAGLLVGMVTAISLFFFSCKKKEMSELEPTTHRVTFDSKDGTAVKAITVKVGDTLTLPADPTKTGFTFGGWYTDNQANTTPFSASTAITANLTLYAKWNVFSLSSTSFADGGDIPIRYANYIFPSFLLNNGEEYLNVSPQLSWENAPEGTTSFFIIMQKKDDYNMFKYSNWYVYNIPASKTSLAENDPSIYKNSGPYRGPWTIGRGINTFQITIYALNLPENYFYSDVDNHLTCPPTIREEIERGMLSRHILASASITGTFTQK